MIGGNDGEFRVLSGILLRQSAFPMRICATAPTRIDLAGGTLDLYPIYLLEDGGLTLNCAINMQCGVTLESRGDGRVCLRSEDLGIEEQYDSVASVSLDGELEIVSRAIKFFRPPGGLTVTSKNHVKKGSGLGASSSLLIAILSALNELTGSPYSLRQLIDIAADLEAQCIRVPTGKQDYFAAAFGGVSALWFEVNDARRECLLSTEEDIRELEERLILSFAGAPRFSGATNWNMIRNYVEENQTTVSGMKRVKKITHAMRKSILERDWEQVASLIDQEWQIRRTLAEGVTTEAVEKIMQAALEAGAAANKLCGAGGGGCMITFVLPKKRQRVEAALAAAGAEVLPFKIVAGGVSVECEPET